MVGQETITNKVWAHKKLFLGIDTEALVLPLLPVYYEIKDYFVTLIVVGLDVSSISPRMLKRFPVLSALPHFSYCMTDDPMTVTPYDTLSLSYNTTRIMASNCEVISHNPFTIRFHVDDLQIQLGKPQR